MPCTNTLALKSNSPRSPGPTASQRSRRVWGKRGAPSVSPAAGGACAPASSSLDTKRETPNPREHKGFELSVSRVRSRVGATGQAWWQRAWGKSWRRGPGVGRLTVHPRQWVLKVALRDRATAAKRVRLYTETGPAGRKETRRLAEAGPSSPGGPPPLNLFPHLHTPPRAASARD